MLIRCDKCGYLRSTLFESCERCEAIAVEVARMKSPIASGFASTTSAALESAKEAQIKGWIGLVVVCVLVVLVVTRCARSSSDQAQTTMFANADRIYAAHTILESRLKDASSAQYKNEHVTTSGVVCGEVNAKNGFGGFAGFERYIAAPGKIAVVESETQDFGAIWDQECGG
jgi:hypothetical protein